MIKASNLQYTYPIRDENGNVIGAKIALDNISFSVNKGEFIAILGHNGSGKSTLARTINALLVPTSGKMVVGGMDTSNETITYDIRSNVGMVFQNPDNQIIASIVEEDVAFGPENMGIESSEINNRVTSSLDITQMSSFRYSSPDALSGGQKQRVAIAGVLAMNPQCIVLDEPTAMLDPSGQKDVLKEIAYLNKQKNVTIILITHNMEEAATADKIIVMDDGKVQKIGTPQEIFEDVEMLSDLGLEVPVVTEIAYKLEKQGIKIPRGILTISELVNEIIKLK